MKPDYGRIKSYEDHNNGLTAERVDSYKDGTLVDSRRRFEERKRVKSFEQAQQEITAIVEKVQSDTSLLDPTIRYVGRALFDKRGFFDIIFEYTIISQ